MKKNTILLLSTMTLASLTAVGKSSNGVVVNAAEPLVWKAFDGTVDQSAALGITATSYGSSAELKNEKTISWDQLSGASIVFSAKDRYINKEAIAAKSGVSTYNDTTYDYAIAYGSATKSTGCFTKVVVPEGYAASINVIWTAIKKENRTLGFAATAGKSTETSNNNYGSDKQTTTNDVRSSTSSVTIPAGDCYINGDGDYIAIFEINVTYTPLVNKYNVTYWNNIGTEYTDLKEVVEEGQKPTKNPTPPDYAGGKFKGWAEEQNGVSVVDPTTFTINADKKFWAIFDVVATHKVKFNENYDSAPTPREFTVNHEETAASHNYIPTREADVDGPWVFKGWYKEAECTNEYTFEEQVTGDIELFAKWEKGEFVKVTFKVDDQAYGSEVKVVKGESFNEQYGTWPEDPTKAHYTFVGWYDAEETTKYDQQSTYSESIELHAKFEFLNVETFELNQALTSDYTSAEWVVENYFGYYGFNKFKDANTAQAKGLRINMIKNGKVTIKLAQTGKNKYRKISILDVTSGLYYATELEPNESNASATDVEISLPTGEYIVEGYGYTGSTDSTVYGFGNLSGSQFNFTSIKFDYTEVQEFVSTLDSCQAMGLYTQTGVNAEQGKAMRFVGALQNVTVDNIASISLDIKARKAGQAIEAGPEEQVLPTDEGQEVGPGVPGQEEVEPADIVTTIKEKENIYSVYDHVSEGTDSKYVTKDCRLYFYYIIDEKDIKDLENLGEFSSLKALECRATLTKTDGTQFVLETTLDCQEAFKA